MSLNVNRVTLAGHLTRDPQMRFTQSRTAVANFGVAINEKWKDGEGKLQEKVTFVDVTAWGKTAETINEHFKKGKPIYLEGRLQLEQWEADGTKHQKLSVVLDTFQFNDGPKPEGRR